MAAILSLYVGCKVDDFRTVESTYVMCIIIILHLLLCIWRYLHTVGLHEAVQQHGPLEEFKKLYSCLSHENSSITNLGHHTLLFRYVYILQIDLRTIIIYAHTYI